MITVSDLVVFGVIAMAAVIFLIMETVHLRRELKGWKDAYHRLYEHGDPKHRYRVRCCHCHHLQIVEVGVKDGGRESQEAGTLPEVPPEVPG